MDALRPNVGRRRWSRAPDPHTICGGHNGRLGNEAPDVFVRGPTYLIYRTDTDKMQSRLGVAPQGVLSLHVCAFSPFACAT